MTEKLFVYGTLYDPDVQMRLVGRTIEGIADRLSGFRRYAHFEYPVILPDADAAVEGYVLSITPDELVMMDEYEGDTYLRIRGVLQSGIEAWVYQGDPNVYQVE